MNDLPIPLAATEIDRKFRIRKGSTKKAFDAGHVRGTLRPGRGGMILMVMPDDAVAWFRDGLKGSH